MKQTDPSGQLAEQYRLLVAQAYEFAGRSRATSEAFARRHGGTAAQWHVLSVILDEPATTPQIAKRLGQARQSVQVVVDELTGKAMVKLIDNPRHARSKLVKTTAAGARFARTLFKESSAARACQINRAALNAEALENARHVLSALLETLDEIDTGV